MRITALVLWQRPGLTTNLYKSRLRPWPHESNSRGNLRHIGAASGGKVSESQTAHNAQRATTMIQNAQSKSVRLLTGGALVVAMTSVLYAQEKPFTQAGTATPVSPP